MSQLPEVKVVRIPAISEEEWREAKEATDREWVKVALPLGWHEELVQNPCDPFYGTRIARHGKNVVIFSAGRHDGQLWLHVSISHPDKMPTYMDLAAMKRIFIGADRQAVQIFAAAGEHVNIHTRALHLWACLEPEGDGLPNFGRFGTI